jgi:hypothetical protein
LFEEVIFAFGNFQFIEVMRVLDKRRREIVRTLNIIDMVHELFFFLDRIWYMNLLIGFVKDNLMKITYARH